MSISDVVNPNSIGAHPHPPTMDGAPRPVDRLVRMATNDEDRRALMRMSGGDSAPTEDAITTLLNEVKELVRVGASALAEAENASPMLVRAFLTHELRVDMRAQEEWRVGEARADGATLANIALATDTRTGNVRKTYPYLDEVTEARNRVEKTGKSETLVIRERHITLNPYGDAEVEPEDYGVFEDLTPRSK